jgi:hypothetical protein
VEGAIRIRQEKKRQANLRRRQGVRFAKEAAIQQAEANRKQEEAEKAKSRRSSKASRQSDPNMKRACLHLANAFFGLKSQW